VVGLVTIHSAYRCLVGRPGAQLAGALDSSVSIAILLSLTQEYALLAGSFNEFVEPHRLLTRLEMIMTQRFEHCRLIGGRITYLGRDGLFEDKIDRKGNEFRAWDYLEKRGWELVSVVSDAEGQHVAYFKRPRNENV
jgi:hypothetical protein